MCMEMQGGVIEGVEGESDRGGVPLVIHLLVSEGDACPPLDTPTTSTTTSTAMDNRYAYLYICILL